MAKLNDNAVREIRELYATGNYMQTELAAMFSVTNGMIHHIVRWHNWKHVK